MEDETKTESATEVWEAKPWDAGTYVFHLPKITCSRCKAQDVEQGWNIGFSNGLESIAKNEYGTAIFDLCGPCTVECWAKFCGIEKLSE